jgi:hypothetical protein
MKLKTIFWSDLAKKSSAHVADWSRINPTKVGHLENIKTLTPNIKYQTFSWRNCQLCTKNEIFYTVMQTTVSSQSTIAPRFFWKSIKMLRLYSMKSSVSYTAVSYASVSNMVLKTWFQWLLLASLLLSDIALGKNTRDNVH